MIRYFQLFIKYLKYIVKAKKKWIKPSSSQIVVYDSSGINILNKYIQKWKPEVIHVRGESINLNVLIRSLFKKGNAHDAYVDEFIKIVKPDLLITFIDNNINFLAIGQRHKSVKTLFIQNGMRYYYGDIFYYLDKLNLNTLEKLQVDYMLAFGAASGNHYKNYISGSIVTCGSIKNNLVHKKSNLKNGVIALISQYKGGRSIDGRYYDYEKYAKKSVSIIIEFLKNYAKINNKELMIIPRFSRYSSSRFQEKKYYDNLLGCETKFLDFDEEYSSYLACDMAEISVSIDSTLGIESIARGNKTAIFSIRGNVLGLKGFNYGWPSFFEDIGPFWTNQPNIKDFQKILDYLFSIDDIQWHKDLKRTNFSSLMEFNEGNSLLQDSVSKILSDSQTRELS